MPTLLVLSTSVFFNLPKVLAMRANRAAYGDERSRDRRKRFGRADLDSPRSLAETAYNAL